MDERCSIGACAKRAKARRMCSMHYYRWQKHGDPDVTLLVVPPTGEIDRFLAMLPADGCDCVGWPFNRNNKGYAIRRQANGSNLVSRQICEMFHGAAPSPRHEAAHSCGNGHNGCVAPWHLSWKTPSQNQAERRQHGTMLFGEDVPTHKLTEADVREILGLRGRGSQAAVGELFGVSQTLIGKIWRGRNWPHLPR